MRYNFEHKVAFVSGGSSGIGKATALMFAREGAKVVVVDVADAEGNKVAEEIRHGGGNALYIHCDVSEDAQMKHAIEETVREFDAIDFAFNNAGIEGQAAPTAECTMENWDKVININLKGVWLAMKYQIPLMIAQGGGSIVNCSSVAGVVGTAGVPAYNASKHGVIGLTETAALEYISKNIRINAVCPGVIHTAMIDRFTHNDPQTVSALTANEPIGRMGRPEEVAEAVLWLSSNNASFITGHALPVDGGWLAR